MSDRLRASHVNKISLLIGLVLKLSSLASKFACSRQALGIHPVGIR